MELTVPQAAKRSRVSEETVRRWVRAGKIPSRKVGTQHMIAEHDLDAINPKRKRSTTSEAPAPYILAREPADQSLLSRIVVNPRMLTGKPSIRGTRISVEMILEFAAAGWTTDEILDSYPTLTLDDIRACFAHAAELVAEERIWSIP